MTCRPRRRAIWVVERRLKGRRSWQPLLDCVRQWHQSALRERNRLRDMPTPDHWIALVYASGGE